MSGAGGFAGSGGFGGVPVPVGRVPLPRPLQAVLLLVRTLFVFTVVGGIGVLLRASSLDAIDGELLGLLLYAALPGAAGFALSLYVRSGDIWIWRGLVAVNGWFLLGALATLSGGGARGVPQLVIPAVTLVLLLRGGSRDWFDLPVGRRAEHRPFSVARLIRWRRDGGQTAVEYLGLIVIVGALVSALLLTGIGGRISGGLRSAICEVTGSACPAPGGDEVVAGDGPESREDPEPGTGNSGTTGTGGATGGTGGAASGGPQGGTTGGTQGAASGGTDGGATGGTEGEATGGTQGGATGGVTGGSQGGSTG
ncbi:hypothetical protein ACN6K8_006701, partial [[Kitasatospora] papulosa]